MKPERLISMLIRALLRQVARTGSRGDGTTPTPEEAARTKRMRQGTRQAKRAVRMVRRIGRF